MESLKTSIKIKLKEISDCIFNQIQEPLQDHIGGLYGGEWGQLLFLCYYAKFSEDRQIKKIAEEYAERLLSHKNLENLSHTFCDGYSGLLYLFEFLKENDLMNIDIDDVESVLETYVIHCMQYNISLKNYDFMHGALGAGYYFLKKGNNKSPLYELIDFLYNTAEKDIHTKCFKWKSPLSENGELGYNIALSHGMSSIVLFLSHMIKKGFKNDKIFELLENTVNYIFSQERDVNQYGSFFPSQSLENNIEHSKIKSRLGWCYGDLGVAYSLWFAGNIVCNNEWTNKGLEVLLHSTQRRDLADEFFIDVGICHGASGIAMMFKRMYLETNHPDFINATDFWMQKTLDIATFPDGLAGYKTLRKEFICDYCLLTGITGIGMILISYLMDGNQSWDELFLL